MPERDRDKNHYSISLYSKETVAREFDNDRFGGSVGLFFKQIHEAVLWSMIPEPSGLRILDLGAGTGRFSIPLAQRDAQVIAADASLPMLTVALEKSKEVQVSFDCVRADAHQLPFADRAFDIVIASRILMHVVNWKRALEEMCRVSSHAVIVDFPPVSSFAGIAPLLLPLKRLLKPDTQVYRVFSEKQVRHFFESKGFFIEDAQRQLTLPFFIHRWIKNPNASQKIEAQLKKRKITAKIGAPAMLLAIRQDPESD